MRNAPIFYFIKDIFLDNIKRFNSEVANKSFDIKNENFKQDAKSDLGDPNKENSSERIEPSFLNNTDKSSFNNSNYDDTFERGLSKEDDSMNIPSFLRRNRE